MDLTLAKIKDIDDGFLGLSTSNTHYVAFPLYPFEELSESVQQDLTTEWYCFSMDLYLEQADEQFRTEHSEFLEANAITEWDILFDYTQCECELIVIDKTRLTGWSTIQRIIFTDDPTFTTPLPHLGLSLKDIIIEFLTRYKSMVDENTNWDSSEMKEDLSRLLYTKNGEGYEL